MGRVGVISVRLVTMLIILLAIVVPLLPAPVYADTPSYFVMGQVFIVNGAHITVAEAGRIATDGNTTLNLTDDGTHGTFSVYMANGTTGNVTSGTSAISGSPVTLAAGLNSITATGTGTCTLSLTLGTAANWNTVNSWAASSGGQCGAAVPTSANSAYFDSKSFTRTSQVLTVDATASCLNMDWTGATNSPKFNLATGIALSCYGNFKLINTVTTDASTGPLYFTAAATGKTVDFAGISFPHYVRFKTAAGGWTLQSALDTTSTYYIVFEAGILDTNNQTVTCGSFGDAATSTNRTLTMGTSTINCTAWTFTGTGVLTLSDTTGTINVSGTGAFSQTTAPTGSFGTVNLNGTAHTISGSNTFVNLTRNGTATKTDTLTLTSDTTQTVTGTCALIGNSATNRLLVQSSTLGSAATLHVQTDVAANWTGTNAVDFMDITSTHAVDFSAGGLNLAGYAGDCGGNTGITCTASDTQTSNAAGDWDDATKWTGTAISRVPLPQDDVACSHNRTVDMPRIGRSITFTGTPTISLSNNIENYGSFILAMGMTYTHSNKINYCRGRSNYTVNMYNKAYGLYIYNPSGTYTLTGDITLPYRLNVYYGAFADGGYTITLNNDAGTANKWVVGSGGSVTLTGTIIWTSAGTNAQTFAGGSLSYNNVTVQGAGNYALTISGNNTFNTFTVDRTSANKTLTLTASSNQTMANFVCNKSDARWLTINSTGGTAYLTKTGGGAVGVTYLNLSNNTGNPATTWYYTPVSVIGANVNNWVLDAPPSITTVGSSLVEETTATTDGNCTNLNFGGNLNYIGCEYGTATATYTGNLTTAVDMGTGTFTENLTALNSGDRYFFRMYGNNDDGTAYGSESTFLTKPDPPTVLTCTTNNTAIDLAWVNAAVGAGTSRYTVVRYKTLAYPTSVTDGTLSYNGTASSYVQMGLTNGVTYYFRAWTFAWDGTDSQYSDTYSSDDGVPATYPTVTTMAASSVEETTATVSGNMTVTGGMDATTEGVQYDTNSGAPYAFDQHTHGSFGVGTFSENLAGLTQGTLYYYRCYATNPVSTGYGAEVTFLTKPLAPTSLTISSVGVNQLHIDWVTGVGASRTLVRYKQDSYPTSITDGNLAYFGAATDTTISGLLENRTYYVRAWGEVTAGIWQQYSDSTADGNSRSSGIADTIIAIVGLAMALATVICMFVLIGQLGQGSPIGDVIKIVIIAALGMICFIVLRGVIGM